MVTVIIYFDILAFMREKQVETAAPPDDVVKLKPFMGIRPGVYLTVLYSLVILVVLFLFLVLPGIRKPGAVLVVKTEPRGAGIRINNVYMGTADEKIFVPKGVQTIEAVLPGFKSESSVHEIPGRTFGSLFFPRRYPVQFTLKTDNPEASFAQAAGDFAAWTFAGEPASTWQIPLSLSEGAYRTGPAGDPAQGELLKAAARFTVTRAALRDLVRAKMLLDNGGLSPSPAGLLNSVSDILAFLSENPGSAQWLSGLLPPETAALVRASAWQKNENPPEKIALPEYAGSPSVRQLEIAGLSFVNVNGFMICDKAVSQTAFQSFLNENPSIAADREQGMKNNFPRGDEITEVSWFEAREFCQWLTKRLPSSMEDMEVRLPTEAEWEYAAGHIGNMGNTLWEWCADPFAPLQFIKASPQAVHAVGSPERSLRRSSAVSENRASLPGQYSSPVVTFRPVIALKSGY
jgi:hypothetical protein